MVYEHERERETGRHTHRERARESTLNTSRSSWFGEFRLIILL